MYVAPRTTGRSWRLARQLQATLQACLLASILLGLIYSSERSVFGLGFSPIQACNARSGRMVAQTMQGGSSAQVTYQLNSSTMVECQAQRMLVLWRATSVILVTRHICFAR